MDTVDLDAGLKAATNDVDEAFEDPQGFQADGAGNCRIPDGQTLTLPRPGPSVPTGPSRA